MAISESCPTLHGRLYLCSVRISRTLSANQIFLAVTSPPNFKGQGGRERENQNTVALISNSTNPIYLFAHPSGPSHYPITAEY
jgi:hypothetical protein